MLSNPLFHLITFLSRKVIKFLPRTLVAPYFKVRAKIPIRSTYVTHYLSSDLSFTTFFFIYSTVNTLGLLVTVFMQHSHSSLLVPSCKLFFSQLPAWSLPYLWQCFPQISLLQWSVALSSSFFCNFHPQSPGFII